MKLLTINRIHWPVTALGPGERVGIWFQGCSLACPGCVSRDTWASDEGGVIQIDALVDWIGSQGPRVTGVTLTGGEPFEQPDGLLELVRSLRALSDDREVELDLLCYSGLSWRAIQQHHTPILAYLDALIPEPFMAGQPTTLLWRGSSNQTLKVFSDLGAQRFEGYAHRSGNQIQVSASGGGMWFIGIPRRGDLARFESGMNDAGIELHGVSWRP